MDFYMSIIKLSFLLLNLYIIVAVINNTSKKRLYIGLAITSIVLEIFTIVYPDIYLLILKNIMISAIFVMIKSKKHIIDVALITIFLITTFVNKSVSVVNLFSIIIELYISIVLLDKYTKLTKHNNVMDKHDITKLKVDIKRQEKNIKTNNEIYNKLIKNIEEKQEIKSTILNNTDSCIIIVDDNGYVIDYSKDFEELYLKDREDDINKLNINTIFNLELASMIKNTKEKEESEIKFITKENRVIKFNISIIDFNNENLNMINITDITYIDSTQDKILENKNKYKKILGLIPNSILVLKDRSIIYKNTKKNISNETIDKILKSKEESQVIVEKHNEKERCLICNKIKYLEDNEEYSVLYIKDMTDHNKLIESINDSKIKYQSLIDIIPEGIYISNNNKEKLVYSNKEIKKILGKYILKNKDVEKIEKTIVDDIKDVEYVDISRSILVNEYEEALDIEAIEVRINNNKKIGIVKDISDIVKKEHLENEIMKKKHINKIKEQFFVNMSHELKAPMNLIYSSNQLLEVVYKGNLDKKHHLMIQDNIDEVKENSYIIMRLIDNIMDLAKLESNFYDNNKDYYNIVDIIEDICIEFNRYTSNNNVDIIFDTYEEEIVSFIDYKNLEKILLTMISIIIRYSDYNSYININLEKSNIENKDKIIIENNNGFNYNKYENDDNKKGIDIGIQVCKLIGKIYDYSINIDILGEKSISVEIYIPTSKEVYHYKDSKNEISKDRIYAEFRKMCGL